MKWAWTPPPRHLDIRRRKLFALVPRPCKDGYVRWLEWLLVTERYDMYDMDADWIEIAA
jgi:hypothetical protein